MPNQKQPEPEKISLSKETTRTAQNNPNTPSKSTNQIAITETVNKSLPQHHLQLTFTRHKTNAFKKLIRFVVPSEIMSTVRELIVATSRDKPHDKHKSPLTETHPTRKWQNTHDDAQAAERHTISNTTSWPMFQYALHRSHGNAKGTKYTSSNEESK